jgi:hypothetical protein
MNKKFGKTKFYLNEYFVKFYFNQCFIKYGQTPFLFSNGKTWLNKNFAKI